MQLHKVSTVDKPLVGAVDSQVLSYSVKDDMQTNQQFTVLAAQSSEQSDGTSRFELVVLTAKYDITLRAATTKMEQFDLPQSQCATQILSSRYAVILLCSESNTLSVHNLKE